METKISLIEPLLERVEEYSKTSLKLVKLKLIDKTADISSTLASRLVLVIVLLFFSITINIALALWLGDLFGKNYYGFLAVAAFYGIAGIILYFFHPLIKMRINNSIINKALN